MIDHAIELMGSITDGIKPADDGPHTGSDNIIDRDTCFFNHFQSADVGHSLGTSTTQDHSNTLTLLGMYR
jgi:hypothetical protein